MRSGDWQSLATTDFAGLDPEKTVALLPVAAIEQHGPHLPLGTDALINDGIVRAALERLPPELIVLVLPPVAIGASLEHARFPGTLSAAPESLAALWVEIGRGVAASGIRKLVIFNTHGGQKAVVDLVALKLRAELGMLVARAGYFAFGAPPGLFGAGETEHDIHGGVRETSLMLHLHPELVRRDALASYTGLPQRLAQQGRWLGVEKPIGIGWLAGDLHPAGVAGDAARADAQRGSLLLDHCAGCLTALLREVAATPLSILG